MCLSLSRWLNGDHWGTEERVGHNQECGFGYVKFEMSMRHTVSLLSGPLDIHVQNAK